MLSERAQTLTGCKNGRTGISGSSAKAKFSLILGSPEKDRFYQITEVSPGECCQDTEEGWNTCDISGEKNRVCSAQEELTDSYINPKSGCREDKSQLFSEEQSGRTRSNR